MQQRTFGRTGWPVSEIGYGLWGMGDHTRPLTAFEAQMRVPLIWRHPGKIAAGKVSEHHVAHVNFFATLLDHVGLEKEKPSKAKLTGRSYAAALRGEKVADWNDTIFYEFENMRCLRTPGAKVIERTGGNGRGENRPKDAVRLMHRRRLQAGATEGVDPADEHGTVDGRQLDPAEVGDDVELGVGVVDPHCVWSERVGSSRLPLSHPLPKCDPTRAWVVHRAAVAGVEHFALELFCVPKGAESAVDDVAAGVANADVVAAFAGLGFTGNDRHGITSNNVERMEGPAQR